MKKIAVGLTLFMMIGVAMLVDLQAINGYTEVTRIFLPDTTVLAASDLSLETNTLVVPNDAELTPVLPPQISVTVTETVQVSDGQQATNRSPLHTVNPLYLSETSKYQGIPNIAWFGSSLDSTQSQQLIFVDFAQPFQTSPDSETFRTEFITIHESVVISDTSQVLLPVSILIDENVVVSEVVQTLLPVLILAYEDVAVSDTAKTELPVSITINESIGIHDATEPDTASQRATGEVLAATNTDINHDRKVDSKDLDLLRASYGFSESETGFNSNADLNRDGWVDLRDLAMFGAFYGR